MSDLCIISRLWPTFHYWWNIIRHKVAVHGLDTLNLPPPPSQGVKALRLCLGVKKKIQLPHFHSQWIWDTRVYCQVLRLETPSLLLSSIILLLICITGSRMIHNKMAATILFDQVTRTWVDILSFVWGTTYVSTLYYHILLH